MWCHTSALGRLRQEEDEKFQASLGHIGHSEAMSLIEECMWVDMKL
jgi:hypothetical protein